MDKFDFNLRCQITDCQGGFWYFKLKALKNLSVYFCPTTMLLYKILKEAAE